MKNKLEDVRNHLVQAMEALNQEDAPPEEIQRSIGRAKAMSNVANSFIESVKVEIDAIKLADEAGLLPSSVAQPVKMVEAQPALGSRRAS